jgi:hypothetical protein
MDSSRNDRDDLSEPELSGAFGEELQARIDAYRRGEIGSYSLEEVQAKMAERHAKKRLRRES